MVVCDLGNPMKAGTKVRFGPAGIGELKRGAVGISLNHSSVWAGGLLSGIED